MKTTKNKLNEKDIKKIFNSPTYKKWAKKMEEMYEEEYRVNIWETLQFFYGLGHKEMIAKPIKLTPSRVSGKKKGKKR